MDIGRTGEEIVLINSPSPSAAHRHEGEGSSRTGGGGSRNLCNPCPGLFTPPILLLFTHMFTPPLPLLDHLVIVEKQAPEENIRALQRRLHPLALAGDVPVAEYLRGIARGIARWVKIKCEAG